MLHHHRSDDDSLSPTYGSRYLSGPVPKYRLADGEMPARLAYQLIHDELALDGNAIDSPGARALLESPHLSRVEKLSLRNAFITALEREQLRARFGAWTAF